MLQPLKEFAFAYRLQGEAELLSHFLYLLKLSLNTESNNPLLCAFVTGSLKEYAPVLTKDPGFQPCVMWYTLQQLGVFLELISMQRYFRINKRNNNNTVINEPDALSTWNGFTKIQTHWVQFSLLLLCFIIIAHGEDGFCVSCPLLPPLLTLISHKKAAE